MRPRRQRESMVSSPYARESGHILLSHLLLGVSARYEAEVTTIEGNGVKMRHTSTDFTDGGLGIT